MTGDDLIALAGNLAVNTAIGSSEARFRSAVSRAYYGAFHLARAFLADVGVQVRRNAEGHTEIYRLFCKVGLPGALKVATLLSSLRSARIRADYDLAYAGFAEPEVAIRSVERAHEIRSILMASRVESIQSEFQARLREP